MSDTATAGSVDSAAETQPDSAGNPKEATATVLQNGSAAQSVDWVAGLQDEGNRALVEAKGWKDKGPDDVIKSYRELESKLGEVQARPVVPGENASQDEWNAFYSKIGRPEKPDGYSFKMPDTVPAELPYDGQSAEEFKSWAHEAGLTPSQAQKIHDRYLGKFATLHEAQGKQLVEKAEAADSAIVKKHGPHDSETHKRAVELGDRAARKLGIRDDLRAHGVIGPNGEVLNAGIFDALVEVGKQLYAEDKLHGGPAAMARNPFSKEHENLTEQGKLVRSDPELAKAFIRSAGRTQEFAHILNK